LDSEARGIRAAMRIRSEMRQRADAATACRASAPPGSRRNPATTRSPPDATKHLRHSMRKAWREFEPLERPQFSVRFVASIGPDFPRMIFLWNRGRIARSKALFDKERSAMPGKLCRVRGANDPGHAGFAAKNPRATWHEACGSRSGNLCVRSRPWASTESCRVRFRR